MDYEKLSNNGLIKHIAETPHDELAWKEFVCRFDEYIRSMVARQCWQKKLHEDFVQEVYKKLVRENCKALREFRGETENAIYTFLTVIIRRLILRKKSQKHGGKEEPIDPPLPAEEGTKRPIDIIDDPTFRPDININLDDIWRATELRLIQVLKGREKERNIEIYRLFVIEQLSPEEIAAQMNLAVKRVRNIIAEIRKTLREGGKGFLEE